jgi:hypothetical protein|tara:strand:- start:171 stop:308 length:138 start_codon:yes stop_codon:yes gene_type:complete
LPNLVEFDDPLLATGKTDEFHDPLEQLARRTTGWREHDCVESNEV